MLKRILPLLLILTVFVSGCKKSDLNTNGNAYKSISMSEGIEQMKSDGGYVLLDVRRADEFNAGHLPGAVNIPNEEIGSEEIPSLPDKNQTVYVYCRSGNRSKQAAEKLFALGYTNIIEIGGINDYNGELEYGN